MQGLSSRTSRARRGIRMSVGGGVGGGMFLIHSARVFFSWALRQLSVVLEPPNPLPSFSSGFEGQPRVSAKAQHTRKCWSPKSWEGSSGSRFLGQSIVVAVSLVRIREVGLTPTLDRRDGDERRSLGGLFKDLLRRRRRTLRFSVQRSLNSR